MTVNALNLENMSLKTFGYQETPGADPGFLEMGVHMYKGVGVFALLSLSHFS